MTSDLGGFGLALEMRGVCKRFPGTLAVDHVDFDVRVAEVHALMGENGAGKSTLMKILAGTFADYEGEILMNGQPVVLHSPAMAKRHGIGMIYQELSLAKPLSIAENLLAGRLPVKAGFFLDRRAMARDARRCLRQVGLEVDPALTVEEISQHEAQLVEIAKVLGNNPCILVMDEPTSALSREEVERLFTIIEDLKRRGLAIIYISHHLPEVLRIADRVTVLRDGRKVATRDLSEVSSEDLVKMMVGESIDVLSARREAHVGEACLTVSRLTRRGFFHDVSFQARRGEILGFAGLSGAGRTEVARSLCGLDPVDSGTVEVRGCPLRLGSYQRALAAGVAYLSEDRKNDGLFLRQSVQQNLMSALTRRQSRFGVYSGGGDGELTRSIIERLEISPPTPGVEASNLSGGNQQKVLLGKWLAIDPEVLILDEPTRGVDIGAKARIHSCIRELADGGTTVILISSDLPELVSLSDRVVVMRGGHVRGEMSREELSEEAVLLAANSDQPEGAADDG